MLLWPAARAAMHAIRLPSGANVTRLLKLAVIVSLSGSGIANRAIPRLTAGETARRVANDGTVYVASRRPLRVGEIVTAKIERSDEYDLHGTVGF